MIVVRFTGQQLRMLKIVPPTISMAELRTPKGTLDYSPSATCKLNHTIKCVTGIFEKHGGQPITTPTFELREILLNKYGEESKLIYNLEDQGGDECSLRYDLTVPFARYITTNRIKKLRRYQIGNVFRRDNPSFKTGRLREFIQADFDICGSGIPSLQDAEVLAMISEILYVLSPDKQFKIRINNRKIITGILRRCGVPTDLHATICSTIDKADKRSWAEIKQEMKAKGLGTIQIDELVDRINQTGNNTQQIEFIKKDSENDEEYLEAANEIDELVKLAEIFGAKNIVIDLSLARGLDYYTGMILEASYEGAGVGSVIGGGRYDRLAGSLGGEELPCVGFSVGISRIQGLVQFEMKKRGVFVGSVGELYLVERIELLKELWGAEIRAETFSGTRVNYGDQIKSAKKGGFEYGLFIGERELQTRSVFIIDLATGERREASRDNFINELGFKPIN